MKICMKAGTDDEEKKPLASFITAALIVGSTLPGFSSVASASDNLIYKDQVQAPPTVEAVEKIEQYGKEDVQDETFEAVSTATSLENLEKKLIMQMDSIKAEPVQEKVELIAPKDVGIRQQPSSQATQVTQTIEETVKYHPSVRERRFTPSPNSNKLERIVSILLDDTEVDFDPVLFEIAGYLELVSPKQADYEALVQNWHGFTDPLFRDIIEDFVKIDAGVKQAFRNGDIQNFVQEQLKNVKKGSVVIDMDLVKEKLSQMSELSNIKGPSGAAAVQAFGLTSLLLVVASALRKGKEIQGEGQKDWSFKLPSLSKKMKSTDTPADKSPEKNADQTPAQGAEIAAQAPPTSPKLAAQETTLSQVSRSAVLDEEAVQETTLSQVSQSAVLDEEEAALLKKMEDRMSNLEKKIFESAVASKYTEAKYSQLQKEMQNIEKAKEDAIRQSQNLMSQVNELNSQLESERLKLQSTTQALGAVKAYETKIAQLEQETQVSVEEPKVDDAKVELKNSASAAKAKKVEAAVSGFPEDSEWKALTAAQFKRKTVADLSEFLLKRNLEAVDAETGKPLPKATLLATAASYLENTKEMQKKTSPESLPEVSKSKSFTVAQEKEKKVTPKSFPEDSEWKSLTVAQFKRKTVADLCEFLSKRNLEALDVPSGKPLKKAILLTAAAKYLERENALS